MEYPEPAQLLHNNDSQLHFPKSSNTLLVVPVKYSFGVIYTSNNSTYANASVSTDQLNFVGEAGVIAFANSLTKTITIAGTPGAQGLTVDYGFVSEALNYSIDYGTL
jgi:hypothetical protein